MLVDEAFDQFLHGWRLARRGADAHRVFAALDIALEALASARAAVIRQPNRIDIRPSADELAAFYADMVNSDRFLPANTTGLRVPSFTAGATVEDLNMVLWVRGNALSAKLVRIDDEGRLHH